LAKVESENRQLKRKLELYDELSEITAKRISDCVKQLKEINDAKEKSK
jgi:hypothetical protein